MEFACQDWGDFFVKFFILWAEDEGGTARFAGFLFAHG